jgi:hypothetical protein
MLAIDPRATRVYAVRELGEHHARCERSAYGNDPAMRR